MNATADDGRYTREYRQPAGRSFTKGAVRLLALFVVVILAIGAFSYARASGWLTPFGIESQTHDTQVVYAIQRTQEVSLLSLGIQGIEEKDTSGELFGHDVPGTGRDVFLQYGFRAKLGIDGAKVDVTKIGEHSYRLSIPEFVFIGYSQPTFKTATESGGLLSFATPDIDKVELVNDILGSAGKAKYIDDNQDLLESQTKVFYDSLITGIDPTAQITYDFSG